MKAFLMRHTSDFDLERELPANAQTLTQDLELNTLWSAMAAGDPFLFEIARRALLVSLRDPGEIVYRQQVLTDCVETSRSYGRHTGWPERRCRPRTGPQCLLLCNESFASTNEREGAMVDERVKVLFVTHMFDLAHGFYRESLATALVLRAPRESDEHRTFKLTEGEPLRTSYGEDSYQRVFGRPLRIQASAIPEARR